MPQNGRNEQKDNVFIKNIIKELQINRLFCTFASKILVEH